MTACTKSETTGTTHSEIRDSVTDVNIDDNTDSTVLEEVTPQANSAENTPQTPAAIPPIPAGPTDSVITTDEVIYSDYPADNLPMEKLSRNITNENQVVYVKIQQAKKGDTFNIKVEHEKPDGNIAIPHVYGPGVQDGPFGRETVYTAPKDGDYTFAFTKNKRAEGNQSGKILITLTKK